MIWLDDRVSVNEEGGLRKKQKFHILVMMTLGITWNGLTEPYFFNKGLTLTSELYYQVLIYYKSQ